MAAILLVAQSVLAAATAHLLILVGAATRRARLDPPQPTQERVRLIVLIPAHDEQELIGRTLASLARADPPAGDYEVVVVADNCTDGTARVSAAAGATVYERSEPAAGGKGRALAWALDRLRESDRRPDAILLVDADCEVTPNLLRAAEARLATGATAIQFDYRVANPEESWSASLRFAGFALMNTIRPLGKSRLGLSAGLFGSGMVFATDLLERQPWRAYSLAEDAEYHARLVLSGDTVVFAPEAAVVSAMPTSRQGGKQQRLRWEAGKAGLARRWAPKLVATGIRRRDARCIYAGVELLVPPQSALASGSAASVALAVPLQSRGLAALAGATLVGQAAFVIVGLALADSPRAVYIALVRVPLFALDGLAVQLRVLRGGGPAGWVRTARRAADTEDYVLPEVSSAPPSGGHQGDRMNTTLTQTVDPPALAPVSALPTERAPVGEAMRRHWLFLALPLVLLVTAGLVVGLTRTPVYSATSSISVGGVDVNPPAVLATGGPAESLAGVFTRALTAPEVIRPLSQKLGLPAEEVSSRLSGAPIPKSNVFQVDATGDTASKAVSLANSASGVVIDYGNGLRRANTANLGQQVRDATFAAVRAKRKLFRLQQGRIPPQGAIDGVRADLRVAQVRVASLTGAYRANLGDRGGQSLLQVFASARSASSDRTSKLELLILGGLVAGTLIGAVLARLRGNRIARRAASA